MANTKISDLTASASSLASTDLAPIVQTPGVGPVKMTGLQLAGGLLGSATFNGSTVTTSQPVLNLSQTWNAGAATFTGMVFNAAGSSDANSAAGSLLLDLQVGATPKVSINKTGGIIANKLQTYATTLVSEISIFDGTSTTSLGNRLAGLITGFGGFGTGLGLAATSRIMWDSGATVGGGTQDLILTRANTATLQLGAADVASGAVPQTLQVQSNTGAGQSGQTFTIKGSAGPAGGGSIIFQTAATTTHAAALTLGANKNATFAGLLAGTSSFDGGINLSSGGVGSITIGNFSGGSTISDIVAIGGGSSGYMSAGISLRSSAILGWAASTNPLAAQDTILARDGQPNTLALRNGTNAQTFNVYNTYTDASNYERGFARWSSNIFQIGLEKAGTGTDRQINIISSSIGGEGAVTISGPSGGNTNVKVTGALQNTTTMIVGQLLRWGGFTADANNTVLDGRSNKMLLFLDGNQTSGAGAELIEMTAPAAPSANRVRIYAEDNGSGKTRLMALFATGAAQQIAIEP